MADYQYIDVTIKPDGKLEVDVSGVKEIDVSGVKGKKCFKIIKGLEDACGGQIESREIKRGCGA